MRFEPQRLLRRRRLRKSSTPTRSRCGAAIGSRASLLTIDVTGAVTGCVAPSTATWRVTVRDDRMSMVWVRGVCPSGEPGDAWVLRARAFRRRRDARVAEPSAEPRSPTKAPRPLRLRTLVRRRGSRGRPYAGRVAAWRTPSSVSRGGVRRVARPARTVALASVAARGRGHVGWSRRRASSWARPRVIPGPRRGQAPLRGSPVAAGVVSELLGGVRGRNGTSSCRCSTPRTAPVDASLVSFEGANFTLTSGEEVRPRRPGPGARLPFSVAANCDVTGARPDDVGPAPGSRPPDGSSVADTSASRQGLGAAGLPPCGVRQRGTGPREQARRRLDRGEGLRTGHLAGRDPTRCGSTATGRSPPTAKVGSTPSDVGVRGRYRLEGELLTVDVTARSTGVRPHPTATWRVTVRNDQMSMVWVRGVCPSWGTGRRVGRHGASCTPAGCPGRRTAPAQVRLRYFLMQCTTPCRSAKALKSASRWTVEAELVPDRRHVVVDARPGTRLSPYPNVGR